MKVREKEKLKRKGKVKFSQETFFIFVTKKIFLKDLKKKSETNPSSQNMKESKKLSDFPKTRTILSLQYLWRLDLRKGH